jgi:AGZA family xanthine/uracil permease-like MFS transporter
MGGRAGYTLATALVIGSAGVVGYFGLFYEWIPKPVIFPILVFVGLEIAAQSFHATPVRHYPAVALACLPALAYLVTLMTGEVRSVSTAQDTSAALQLRLQTLHELSGGFIITSLAWASALAALIDRRLATAGLLMLVCAACSLFGVIHSPLPSLTFGLGRGLRIGCSSVLCMGTVCQPCGFAAQVSLVIDCRSLGRQIENCHRTRF